MIAPGYSSHSIDFTPRYVFIGTHYGANVYDKKAKKWGIVPFEISERKAILGGSPGVRILAIKAHKNDVWFGTYQKGAYRYNLESGELTHYEAYRSVYNRNTREYEQVGNCELLDNTVSCIRVHKGDNLWFTSNTGLSELSQKGWRSFPSKTRSVVPTCMDTDEHGRIWVGKSGFYRAYYDDDPPEQVVGGGISVFDGERWVHYYASNYDLQNPDESHIETDLISNDVVCMAMDDHEVWIGTTRGISVYDRKTQKWKDYTTENSGIKSNRTTSIAVGQDAIWVASDSGICRHDKTNGSWFNYGSDVLPFPYIRSVGYDKYGKSVWAVTGLHAYHDIYVYRFDGSEWSAFPTRRRLYPRDEQEYLRLGKFLKGRKARREARAVFGEMTLKYPGTEESIEAEYEWLITGDTDIEDLRDFQTAHSGTPYVPRVQLKIAELYAGQRDYKRAIEEYQRFIEMVEYRGFVGMVKAPGQVRQARSHIADYYGILRDFENEIQVRRDMYDKASDDRTAMGIANKIGDAYMNGLKDYRKAIRWFEICSGWRGVLSKIGQCYELLGDDKKALESYLKAGGPKRKIVQIENRVGIEREYPIEIVEADTFDKRRIWFGSEGGGMYEYATKEAKWSRFTTREGLNSNIVEQILVTKKHIWVKTEAGLNRVTKTDRQIKHYDCSGDIAYDGRYVWMTASRCLVRYDETEETSQELKSDSIPVGGKILVDGEYIWTLGRGYVSGYNLRERRWDKYGMAEYSIRFRANDEGFIWFAAYGAFGGPAGVYRFDKKTQGWKLFLRTHAEKIMPTDKYVWFLDVHGMVRYDRETEKVESYSLSKRSGIAEGFLVNDIALVGKDVWVGFPKGMARFNEKENRWEEYYAPEDFSILNIHFLTVENGNIWFRAENGSNFFNTKTKEWSITHLRVARDFYLTDDSLWMINWEGKVFRYDLKTRAKEEIQLPPTLRR